MICRQSQPISWSTAGLCPPGLPLQAHRYIIEELGGEHAQTMLIRRYIKFLQNVKKSPKLAVQLLLQKVIGDLNTMTGKNVRYIIDNIGHQKDILTVNPDSLKNKLRFCGINNADKWRVNFEKELVNIKQNSVGNLGLKLPNGLQISQDIYN
jgi:hypothetical protein